VKEVFAKGAPAPAKLALPLALFLLPPALAASEGADGSAEEDAEQPVVLTAPLPEVLRVPLSEDSLGPLPEVFGGPPAGVQMSEAEVEEVRARTAMNRLQRVAAMEPELNELKYNDPKAALLKLGVELPGSYSFTVKRNEDSGGDVVLLEGPGLTAEMHYDERGVYYDPEADMGPFAARGDPLEDALSCCWTDSPTNACAASSGTCSKGAAQCYSPYFSSSNGFHPGYMMCDTTAF